MSQNSQNTQNDPIEECSNIVNASSDNDDLVLSTIEAPVINQPERVDSPDIHCTICLFVFINKCYSNACLHTFCFECLKHWASIKSSCPLCKKHFDYIYHTLNNQGHETYTVVRPNRSLNGNFIIHAPIVRDRIYVFNMWSAPLPDSNGQFINCNSAYFRANPEQWQRLKQFITRDFHAILRLLNSNSLDSQETLIDTIMQSLLTYNINDTCFRSLILPHFHEYSDHFIHELYNFANSPYNFEEYNENVRYLTRHNTLYNSTNIAYSIIPFTRRELSTMSPNIQQMVQNITRALETETINFYTNNNEITETGLTTHDTEARDQPSTSTGIRGSLNHWPIYRSNNMNRRIGTHTPRLAGIHRVIIPRIQSRHTTIIRMRTMRMRTRSMANLRQINTPIGQSYPSGQRTSQIFLTSFPNLPFNRGSNTPIIPSRPPNNRVHQIFPRILPNMPHYRGNNIPNLTSYSSINQMRHLIPGRLPNLSYYRGTNIPIRPSPPLGFRRGEIITVDSSSEDEDSRSHTRSSQPDRTQGEAFCGKIKRKTKKN